MPALRSGRHGAPLQKQAMDSHDAIDPLGVDWSSTLTLSLTSQQTPDPSVSVAGQVGNGLPYFFHQVSVVCSAGLTAIPPISRSGPLCCHI